MPLAKLEAVGGAAGAVASEQPEAVAAADKDLHKDNGLTVMTAGDYCKYPS